MITISLWQPWASAIAVGLKKIETRSWPAECVGRRIAIHAAKRDTRDQRAWWMENVKSWKGHAEKNANAFEGFGIKDWADLPFGKVVCTAKIARVETTEFIIDHGIVEKDSLEYLWGNYSIIDDDTRKTRYGWQLEEVIRLQPPIPLIGRQGFYMWDAPAYVR